MHPMAWIQRNTRVVIVCIFALIVGAGLWYESYRPSFSNAAHDSLAREIIATCKDAPYPPKCYDEEVPKLMDRGLSMEDAFAVTRIIQNTVPNYYYCHVLGHKLSEKETAKDPSKWTSVIARCPVGQCSNGCLHGAAQERFRNDTLTPEQIESVIHELAQTCEPSAERAFTGLEKASCYHSLGHLTMYITGADSTAATGVCDRIARKGKEDYTQLCYEGAYMQIFQPLEPEDFALVRDIPATTTALAQAFCNRYEGERRAACNRESWPLYRETLSTAEGLSRFCALTPGEAYEGRCYSAMFYVLTAMTNFDDEKVVSLCEGLSDRRKAQCYANAASRYLETDYRLIDKAVGLCKKATESGVGEACYRELVFYSSYNFHKGSEAFSHLCASLPDSWKEMCLSGEGMKLEPNRYFTDSEPR